MKTKLIYQINFTDLLVRQYYETLSDTLNVSDINTEQVNFYGAMLWTANSVRICNQAAAPRGPELVSNSNRRAKFDRQYSITAGYGNPHYK